ncbi:MAG: HNH endonuclease, partial [Firmicutes bacterium]|nr:HNH endonuclease [Bacillota bacterium]
MAIIGQVAHIQAYSDDGPRANPHLSDRERDCYDNWILLCSTHHLIVDAQPNTYTAHHLRTWKRDHEEWVEEALRNSMQNVTFTELDIITRAIIQADPQDTEQDLTLTPPTEKLKRNELSSRVGSYIRMGLIRSPLVQRFLSQMSQLVPDFPERLKNGFITEYNRQRDELRLHGDELFVGLVEFAAGYSKEFVQQAAGLAVLTYLFV